MSYLQGTVVRAEGKFKDTRTGASVTPPEVVLIISRPDRTQEVRRLSEGTVHPTSEIGLYYAEIDTSAAFGTWRYQFGSQGPAATFEQKSFMVRKALVEVA